MRSCYKWQYSSFLMKKGSWLDDRHPSLPTQRLQVGVTKWTKGAGVRLWVWVRSVWLYNLNFHKVIMLKWILKTNLRKILCIFFFFNDENTYCYSRLHQFSLHTNHNLDKLKSLFGSSYSFLYPFYKKNMKSNIL